MRFFPSITYRLAVILSCCLVLGLSACSTTKDEKKEEKQEESASATELFNKGSDQLDKGRYSKAISTFQDIERLYPYAKEAPEALIMTGLAQYRDEDYDSAVATIDNFITLHPSHNLTPYAFYLRALCHYEQIVDIGRDQDVTRKAQQSLQELIARFPDSEYARDAKLKLDLVDNHLAGKEMEVGRYYEKQNRPIAAINRFKNVVNKYQSTAHVSEALYRISVLYYGMGIDHEAVKYASVLGHNFSDSKWYRAAYNTLKGRRAQDLDKPTSWTDKIWPFGKE